MIFCKPFQTLRFQKGLTSMLLKYVPTHVTHPYGDSARSALHRPAIQVCASRLDWLPTRDKSLCGPVSGAARSILNRSRAFSREQCASSQRTTKRCSLSWKVRARPFQIVRVPFRTLSSVLLGFFPRFGLFRGPCACQNFRHDSSFGLRKVHMNDIV